MQSTVDTEDARYASQRDRMVEEQIASPADGRTAVTDARVLAALRDVPRHKFVPDDVRDIAYADRPLPIGHGQTISQPYIVAAMTELLQPQPDHVVLEVGTGCGYQAAVLARLVRHVYSIEIVRPLAELAQRNLAGEGFENVTVRAGDGYAGWPEYAPFDGIIVTAAPDHVPQPLIDQLRPGGRLVIPVGPVYSVQELLLIKKKNDGSVATEQVMAVGFVPLTREN